MNRRKGMATVLWLVLGASVLAGCGARAEGTTQNSGGDGTDSNTHWLGRCDLDEQCTGSLQCVCGVCSAPCDDSAMCDELGSSAQCVQALCEEDSKRETGLCSRSCENDSECPADGHCEQGVCLPSQASPLGQEQESTTEQGPQTEEPTTDAPETEGSTTEQEPGTEGSTTEQEPGTEGSTTAPEPTTDWRSVVPEGCEFLLESPAETLVEFPEWEGAARDGRLHAYRCTVAANDANGPLSDTEWSRRMLCTTQWLEALGARDATVDADVVVTTGAWAAMAALDEISAISCRPSCDAETCGYCTEFDMLDCVADPFCATRSGAPLDEVRQCREPYTFATCAPNLSCDDAETVARDADGKCWYFGSICYDSGFEYFDSEGDGTCRADQPSCGGQPPVEGCEAMDAQGSGAPCDIEPSYKWNGTDCEAVACDCDGDDCERVDDTLAECQAHWAGCMGSIPVCTLERVPFVDRAVFNIGAQFEPPDLALGEWTTTTWAGPIALPDLPEACPDVDGFEGSACGFTMGLSFEDGFDSPLRLDLALPEGVWERLDVTVGDSVEVRLTDTEFSVRSIEDQLLIVMAGRGGTLGSGLPSAAWSVAPFEVQVADPFCKRPDEDEPGCNWLGVYQNMRFSSFAGSGDPAQSLTLEPFRSGELSVETDAGGLLHYQLMHSASVYHGSEHPNLETCAAAFTRGDAFSIARVIEEP